jgi:hypothetical protein
MTAFTVAVSAGHHPAAKGATFNGVSEYDESVPWQQTIVDMLNDFSKGDPNIYLIGKLIGTGKLPSKVAEINAIKAVDLAIEIHFNAGGDKSTRGTETLFCPDSEAGFTAAKVMNKAVVSSMGKNAKNRGIKEGWYKMDRPGVKDYNGDVDGDENPDYFLAKTRPVALILEPEFMQQIETIQECREPACRAICGAIYNLADRKHYLYNLPPEKRPSGLK